MRYFRLPPNLAQQRKLIDLANHTPSFMPYKSVVTTFEFESGSAMASSSRSSREQTFDIEKAVRRVLEEETDNGGMPSDEESDLDNQLYDLDNNWSDEDAGSDDDGADIPSVVLAAPTTPAPPVTSAASAAPPAAPLVVEEVHEILSGSHPPTRFHSSDTPPARPARTVHAADQPTNRGAGHGRGRAAGRRRRRSGAAGQRCGDSEDEAPYLSYDDPDVPNPLPPFVPGRDVGFQLRGRHLRNTMTRAIDFFDLFFTDKMIGDIVRHTNSYAQEKVFSGEGSSYTQSDGSWRDVTADEIKRFIALLIHFGVVHVRGDVQKNWSTKTLYHGLWARAILSRQKYFAILAMLHVVDPATKTPGNKLRDVESFVTDFKKKCSELYQPRQHVAIDERMVKSRHRSGFRQFIKDKPTRWGIKLWVLADSSNGYTIDFNIYIGRAAGQDVSEHGLGYDVVMRLMSPYFNRGYHLFVDNFYSSLILFKDLFDRGVLATGTILETRRSFPATLKNSKEWAKGKERGCMRWVRDPPCLVLQWVDNKVVSMITTVGNANDHVQVSRKERNAGSWTERLVQQPQIFQTYNKKMNAVDRSDQILSSFNIQRKSMQWWKTLFYHLIDIAVVNSYILFLDHQARFPDELERPAGYSQCDFRDELVRQICDFDEYGDPPVHTSGRPKAQPSLFETQHLPLISEKKRNCVVCYKQEKVERKISTYCGAPQCQGKHMHITRERNCFKIFHSKEYQSK